MSGIRNPAALPSGCEDAAHEEEQKAFEKEIAEAGITVLNPVFGNRKKPLLTEAEADERAARLRAAGITVAEPTPSETTITLLRKRPPDTPEDERASDTWADDGGSPA